MPPVTVRHRGTPQSRLFALLFAGATITRAAAGPPFLTDDPVPTGYQHYEFYAFVTSEKNAGISSTTNGPAFEFNYGALRNVQVSISVPYTFLSVPTTSGPVTPQSIPGTTVSGIGDTEFGVKLRFLQETVAHPQLSFYPSVEFPTGNGQNGIGNGRAWYRFPLWLQKSWGRWTTYGGGGYAVNTAPEQRNFAFGGWLVQRDFSENLTVGAEIYSQGPQFTGDKSSTFYDAGSYIALTKSFGLLFSIGHTFSGDNESVGYFALGWTGTLHRSAAMFPALGPQATPSGALVR